MRKLKLVPELKLLPHLALALALASGPVVLLCKPQPKKLPKSLCAVEARMDLKSEFVSVEEVLVSKCGKSWM